MNPTDSLAESRGLTTSALLSSQQDESALSEFARSVVYAGLQSPVNAIVQPIDRAFGSHLQESCQRIDAPQHAEFNTTRYWIQQSGTAVGMLASFAVAAKLTKCATRAGLSEAQLAQTLSGRGALGLTMKEAALTGFVHDTFLRPTNNKDQRSLVEARLASGVNGAAVMTFLTASTIGLKSLGQKAALETSILEQQGSRLAAMPEGWRQGAATLLKSDMFTGTVSGLAAGGMAVQGESLLKDGHLASLNDTFKGAYTMSVVGGGFGIWHQAVGQHQSERSNFKWSDTPAPNRQFEAVGGERAVTAALANVDAGFPTRIMVRENLGAAHGLKGLLGGQHFGPEQPLVLLHKTANGPRLDSNIVRPGDTVASCYIAPEFSSQAAIQADTLFLRAGKDRFALSEITPKVAEGERTPRQLGEPLDFSAAPQELQAGLKQMSGRKEMAVHLEAIHKMGLDKLPSDVQKAIAIAEYLEPADFKLVLDQYKPKEVKVRQAKPKPEPIAPEVLRNEVNDTVDDAYGRWSRQHPVEHAQRVKQIAFKFLSEHLPGVHPEDMFNGLEQFAVVLSDGTVLKIQTHDTWLPEWGKRPFDAPLKAIGGKTIWRVGPSNDPWIVYRQPYLADATSGAVIDQFHALLEEHGHLMGDGGQVDTTMHQIGMYKGQPRLFDYPSVN